ncbi:GntR family transcriptional regulator [Pectobacterium polaris]|uniref:GntR family transcriptional regulator n=1 Tax=Pectobacterium polaris TaxID=2042057 RepID=UPI0020C688DF|nr:GntR family transcriptional regulator [Pectobacterium polaris]
MTRTFKLDLQHLQPSAASDEPIYQQLYRSFREAIITGKLRPGDRVPSMRSLASELGLARGTIELGLSALDAFPRTTWGRLACRTLRALDVAAMNPP